MSGFEVDFHRSEQRLVVGADGGAFHDHAFACERDRRRDPALAAAGWRVIRVGRRQVVHEPESVAATLRSPLR